MRKLKKKILLVDDEEAVLDIVKSVLDSDSQVVMVAHNGEEALALVKKQSFDLVITDIKMPGIDGIQLLTQIKKINSEIDVFILSAYGDLKTHQTAMNLGAVEYINKPFPIKDIQRRVQHYLNSPSCAYLYRIKSKLKRFWLKFRLCN